MPCISPILYLSCICLLVVVVILLILQLNFYFRLLQIDEMTSIKNYRGFQKISKKIIRQHKKKNTSFSLAIIDIDEFRNYNIDSYAFGDCVLKNFVTFISQQIPNNAYFARFRFGDEFILILPCDLTTSIKVINELQTKCRENNFVCLQNQRTFNIRFSYGIALFETTDDSMERLLINAEKALKENKINAAKYE